MKKLRFKRLPLFAELYLFLVITMILPLAIVTYNGSSRFLAYSEEEIIASAGNNLSSLEKYSSNVSSNLISKIINLSRDSTFNDMVRLKQYDMLRSNPANFDIVRRLSTRLKDLVFSNPGTHSVYFWPQGADYLVTTRNDTVVLDTFYDKEWLSLYLEEHDGNGNHWIPRRQPYEALPGSKGQEGTIDVLTFLYHTTNFTTSAHGVIAVNLYEKDFSEILNNSEFDADSSVFAIDGTGAVLTHFDKQLFASNQSQDPVVARILSESARTGWFIETATGGRTLYCWNRSTFNDWTFISRHSLDQLLNRSNALRNQQLLIMVLFSLAGLFLAWVFSRLVTKPLRQLVGSIASREGARPGGRSNELVFLSEAFDRITEQEADLSRLLRRNEESLSEKHLTDLLKGNVSTEMAETVQGLFPHPNLMVAMIAIDHAQSFNDRYTPDQRAVMKALVQQRCMHLTEEQESGGAATAEGRVSANAGSTGIVSHGVIYDENTLAVVLNLASYDWNRTSTLLRRLLGTLQRDIAEILGGTVSIGVSGCHGGIDSLSDAAREAEAAVRRKLLAGTGCLLFHTPEMSTGRGRYFYPFDREKGILNCIGAGNAERLDVQLRDLITDLRRMQEVSCDNIVQIFNQLVSAVIKYLAENNSGALQALPNLQTLYADIAGLETLTEIGDYMQAFFQRLMPQIQQPGAGDQKNIDRIMSWLTAHFTTEINFEEMAAELKISYSYMRRIVKETTGKGLLDCVNQMRIAEAKRLLRQSAMPIGEIAAQLGYNNAQSFTRFFKKFEGVTPGEYRNTKG